MFRFIGVDDFANTLGSLFGLLADELIADSFHLQSDHLIINVFILLFLLGDVFWL